MISNWVFAGLFALALAWSVGVIAETREPVPAPPRPSLGDQVTPDVPPGAEVATFAGGCFWCVQADFDQVAGVLQTVPGYMGGHSPNPTYYDVARGLTGHAEVVRVAFDPKVVSFRQLVDGFWHTIDPYDPGGQFCDRGSAYRTAIFTYSDAQRQEAEASKRELARSGPQQRPVATGISAAGAFTAAEEKHQNYYRKNPIRYAYYRFGCGRDARLERVWGKKATQ